VTLGNDNGTDGQTDRRTDRVRRIMRPPPREEGRIIIITVITVSGYLIFIYSITCNVYVLSKPGFGYTTYNRVKTFCIPLFNNAKTASETNRMCISFDSMVCVSCITWSCGLLSDLTGV